MTVSIPIQPVPFSAYCSESFCFCFHPCGHPWFKSLLCSGVFSLGPMVRYTAFSAHGGSSIGRSCCGCVLWHSVSSSFPVHCCLVIRGIFVRLLEKEVLVKCTSHRYVKKRALRIGGTMQLELAQWRRLIKCKNASRNH